MDGKKDKWKIIFGLLGCYGWIKLSDMILN